MRKVLCIVSMIVVIFVLFSLPVFAATKCPICGGNTTHDLSALSGTGRTVYDMSCVVYGGQLFDEGDDGLSTFEVLKFDIDSPSFRDLWSAGETYYNILATIGKLLAVVFVMIEMMDRSMNDFSNPEHIAKGFLKLVIAIIIIDNGYQIAEFILAFASHAFNLINVNGVSNLASGGSSVCLYGKLRDAGFFECLGEMASLFLPWVLMQAAKLITFLICWSRILEIMIRVMFAPIGMADIVSGGTQSSGFRYLKKLGAAGLQGAIILAITQAYSLIAGLISTYSGGWIVMVMLAFVVITLMFKASSLANEVMGA